MPLPKPGDVLNDKHRIDAVIGEGGFGVVYRGTTLGTERPVAIKVLKAQKGSHDEVRVERFMRELRAIAALVSPHTITLFDSGRTGDGAPFMVCEFVDGMDLGDVLAERGKLTEKECAHVTLQLLMSLSEAHNAGILHRDIKPENVRIFDYQGDPLRVKLLDFGLAMSVDGAEARLTGTGRVIGTPRYMAPEQLAGKQPQPQTDLFAVGLLMYEMLLGYPGRMVGQLGQLPQLTNDDGVSSALQQFVNRLLAPEPKDRTTSASEGLAELRQIYGAMKSEARGTLQTMVDRAPPWFRQTSRIITGRWKPNPAPRLQALQAPQAPQARRRWDRLTLMGVVGVLVGLVGIAGLLHSIMPSETDVPVRVKKGAGLALLTEDEDEEAQVEPEPPPQSPPVSLSEACGEIPLLVPEGFPLVRDPVGYIPRDELPVLYMLAPSTAEPNVLMNHIANIQDTERFILVVDTSTETLAELDERVRQLAELRCLKDVAYLVGVGERGELAQRAACSNRGFRSLGLVSYLPTKEALAEVCETPVPTMLVNGMNSNRFPPEGGTTCRGDERVSLARAEAMWGSWANCGGLIDIRAGRTRDPTTGQTDRDFAVLSWLCTQPLQSVRLRVGDPWVPLDRVPACNMGVAPQPFSQTLVTFLLTATERMDEPRSMPKIPSPRNGLTKEHFGELCTREKLGGACSLAAAWDCEGGCSPKARRWAERATQLLPRDAASWTTYGKALCATRQTRRAATAFKTACRLSTKHCGVTCFQGSFEPRSTGRK